VEAFIIDSPPVVDATSCRFKLLHVRGIASTSPQLSADMWRRLILPICLLLAVVCHMTIGRSVFLKRLAERRDSDDFIKNFYRELNDFVELKERDTRRPNFDASVIKHLFFFCFLTKLSCRIISFNIEMCCCECKDQQRSVGNNRRNHVRRST
jgi:hypothetical protein